MLGYVWNWKVIVHIQHWDQSLRQDIEPCFSFKHQIQEDIHRPQYQDPSQLRIRQESNLAMCAACEVILRTKVNSQSPVIGRQSDGKLGLESYSKISMFQV